MKLDSLWKTYDIGNVSKTCEKKGIDGQNEVKAKK